MPGFSGYLLVCAGPVPPKFSSETVEVIKFIDFGFDKLAFSYKDVW